MALTQDELTTLIVGLNSFALAQLYRTTKYPRTGITEPITQGMSPHSMLGKTHTLTRPKRIGAAQEIDPRSSGLTFNNPGHVQVPIVWDKLFGEGFTTYGIDKNIPRYVRDFGMSCADAIATSFDNYLYTKCFRDYSGIAASGTVNYGGQLPPIAMIWKESSGGVLQTFSRSHLVRAGQAMSKAEVPAIGRYALVSPTSVGDYLESAPTDQGEGFAGAQAGGVGLLTNSLATGFINRHTFQFSESNAITGQTQVSDLADGAATCAISSPTADTTVFFDGERATSTALGAVRITLTLTGAMDAGIAVGKIGRLGPDAGAAKAYGVILRVDTGNKYVWLVPFDANGQKLTAAQIVAGTDKFGIPQINAVNTAHHQEHIAYITAPLHQPTTQGAIMSQDSYQGITLNTIVGNYDVGTVSEKNGCFLFSGATPTDPNKALLMLSA